MKNVVVLLVFAVFVSGCSSFSEDTFHELLTEADELTIECAVFKQEVACNKALNKVTRLYEYMVANSDEANKHLRSHSYDAELYLRIQKSFSVNRP